MPVISPVQDNGLAGASPTEEFHLRPGRVWSSTESGRSPGAERPLDTIKRHRIADTAREGSFIGGDSLEGRK